MRSSSCRAWENARSAKLHLDFQWVRLAPGSPLVQKSIGESQIRKATGVSVVGVIRDYRLAPNPDAGFRFEPDDLVAVIGTERAREAFRAMSRPPDQNS